MTESHCRYCAAGIGAVGETPTCDPNRDHLVDALYAERDHLWARIAELEAALALARRDLSEARATAAAAASEKRP